VQLIELIVILIILILRCLLVECNFFSLKNDYMELVVSTGPRMPLSDHDSECTLVFQTQLWNDMPRLGSQNCRIGQICFVVG